MGLVNRLVPSDDPIDEAKELRISLLPVFGYMRRRCTSNAKHSSATSLGRERDRPVRFSFRRNRWRTVFRWQKSTSAAPRTDASWSCHTRNVSKSISRSWSTISRFHYLSSV